jgi:hypothetical protein
MGIEKEAKLAFSSLLAARGFDILPSPSPVAADIASKKRGRTFYWEIKSSRLPPGSDYFCAITGNELVASIAEKHYHFVLAWRAAERWQFKIVSPADAMLCSRFYPTFCCYSNFRLDAKNPLKISKGGSQTVVPTEKKIKVLHKSYRRILGL